jgi:hypothetical protein
MSATTIAYTKCNPIFWGLLKLCTMIVNLHIAMHKFPTSSIKLGNTIVVKLRALVVNAYRCA